MHQPSQGKNTSGHAQANAAPSQPQNTPMHPKKNGSGLLSSYNAKGNNAQRRQPVFQSTPPGSIAQPPHSTQAPRTEVRKQNPYPGSPVSREGNNSLASHAATPSLQRPAQQPPNSFASPNAPQRPAQQPPNSFASPNAPQRPAQQPPNSFASPNAPQRPAHQPPNSFASPNAPQRPAHQPPNSFP